MSSTPFTRTPTRYDRQTSFLPPDKLKQISVVIVGLGALGRPTAALAASTGFGRIGLFDDDTIETPNLAAQGYKDKDLGRLKVEVVAEEIQELNPETDVYYQPIRLEKEDADLCILDGYDKGLDVPPGKQKLVVISCVDSIDTRAMLWKSVSDLSELNLFLDGRMAGPVIQTYAVNCQNDTAKAAKAEYAKSLFKSEEAFEAPCTARTLLYPCFVASGLMVGQISNWIRGLPADSQVSCNLNIPSAMSLT
jgi:hypothetical protein|tara:strand:+ start:1718 stop:2467 length:750 start_codon:yes stop_codon:yes gene_type:complete